MLPKKRRISRSEFGPILSKGLRSNSTHLLMYISRIPENSSKISQFSFSVSKKVCKLAVDRNRLRRRGYSVISALLPGISMGYLCFFSFKKGSKEISFSDLQTEVKNLLTHAGVLV